MRRRAPVLNFYKSFKRLGVRIWERSNNLNTTNRKFERQRHPYEKLMRSYEPSNWMTLRRINRVIQITDQDILIDFGSGKGRILYLAAHYPFKKLIGVEITEHLHKIAKKNLRVNKSRLKCKNIELVNADAATYIPEDDFTVAYFFNPFVNNLFEKVIQNIHNSLLINPRKIWIIYKKPVMKAHLDDCDWLTLKHTTHNIAFYRSTLPEE